MAKEQCAICGNMVGPLYRQKLGDGAIVCADCWALGKVKFGVAPKDFTIEGFRHHLETDERAVAAQEKQEMREAVAQIKQDRRDQSAMDKMGLNLDRYGDGELRSRNIADISQLSASLAGSKLYSFGSLLSGNPSQTFLMEMERAQVAQNNILIRQNEEIIRLLQAIAGRVE